MTESNFTPEVRNQEFQEKLEALTTRLQSNLKKAVDEAFSPPYQGRF